MSPLLERINARMHDHTCPSEGSLGECPALIEIVPSQTIHGERVLVTAALYIWDAAFNDPAAVAGWFTEEGALEVIVAHTLHDPFNEVFAGKDVDSTRPWTVSAWFPPCHPSIADITETPRTEVGTH